MKYMKVTKLENEAHLTFGDYLGYIGMALLIAVMAVIALPFMLLYLVWHLLMTPYYYAKHKRSRYQQDFPCKYSWPMYEHIDDEAYAAIRENDLPVEYFKWCEDYEWGGYFVHKDTLLCFQNPFFFDKEKGLLLCWLNQNDEGEEAEWAEDTEEDNTDDCLTVVETQAYMLEEFRKNVPGRECKRVVFFCQRKRVEKNYEEGTLERMRQLDDFVIYEKGKLAKAIREFIEERR